MKKFYNALFLFLISIACFCINTTNVKAYGYGLWVNGEEFGSDKTTINCGSGTATFDYSSNTNRFLYRLSSLIFHYLLR